MILRCIVFAIAVAASPAAIAHAFLDRASPAVGSEIRGAPAAVTLRFTEPIEPAFSSLKVVDAQGATVDRGDASVDPSDRTVFRVSLQPLVPGTYRVVWRVLSVDTHATNGDFTFKVVP